MRELESKDDIIEIMKIPNVKIIPLQNQSQLFAIEIDYLSDEIIELFDKWMVHIYDRSKRDITLVKKKFKRFLSTKKGSTTEVGAVAEFVSHVFLNELCFTPIFLFKNLEEGSIKKGFDGYYQKEGKDWLFESKSGEAKTKGINHLSKFNLGIKDLKDKITDPSLNDPWDNAFSHANQICVNSPKSLLKKLEILSDNFINENMPMVSSFNVIPGSTIFFENTIDEIGITELKNYCVKEVRKNEFREISFICINKSSIERFKKYLG